MKGISLKGSMPFGFGGVYEKNSLYAILLGAAGPVFRLRLRVVERKRYTTSNLFKFSYIFVSNYVSWNENATPQVIYSNFHIFSFLITCQRIKMLYHT